MYRDNPDVSEKGLILRDYLAADRTTLANERTLLAYIRTTLTFLIGGVTFIQFFDSFLVEILGYLFLPSALVTATLGVRRYRTIQRSVARAVAQPSLPEETVPGESDDA